MEQQEFNIGAFKARMSKIVNDPQYYNSIKFMVHMADSPEKRTTMLSVIAYKNPVLCAKIITTICENTLQEEIILNKAIEERLERTSARGYKRANLLLALFELGNYSEFKARIENDLEVSDWNTLSKVVNGLDPKQLLVLIEILLTTDKKRRIGAAIQRFEKIYDGRKSINDDILRVAQLLYREGMPGNSYRILRAAKMDRSIIRVLGETQNIESSFAKKSFSSVSELEVLLTLKHGYSKAKLNDISFWDTVLRDDKEVINTAGFYPLIKHYGKHGEISKETIYHILSQIGFHTTVLNEDSILEYLPVLIRHASALTDPFYSAMQNESQMMHLLDDSSFANPYKFSEDSKLIFRINGEPHFDTLSKSLHDYFGKCAINYKNPANLVRAYFNSPIKTVVTIEYLLKILMTVYNCDEKRVKELLDPYTFKGKVRERFENIVSIRAFNVCTIKPCRVNTKKHKVCNREPNYELTVGDVVYFKFNYIEQQSKKINVYHLRLSTGERAVEEERTGANGQ